MLKYVRVASHKGVKRCELHNLSQLNVLVGKNNSGKSSLLEAMATSGKCFAGIMITDDALEEILSKHLSWMLSRHGSENLARNSHLNLATFIAGWRDQIFFEEELQKWADQAYQYVSPRLGGKNREVFQFEVLFESMFENVRRFRHESGAPVLVPAKRQIESSPSISFNQSTLVDPVGTVLLNQLFYLKNQSVRSSDYAEFLQVSKAFGDVTSGLEFNIIPDRKGKLELLFSDFSGEWFPARDCGLGLQDILVIVSVVKLSQANLVMIEEPENHIHPDKQRRLLSLLRSEVGKQFFLATHSGIFIDPAYIDRAFYVERNDNGIAVRDRTSRAELLKGLGYSIADNIGCDLVVLTEGPNDGPVLEEICRKLGFWSDFTIRFWPLGGDNMARFDFSLISESYDPCRVIALIDKDPKSRKARQKFQANCDRAGIKCVQLKRYAIENYATIRAINQCRIVDEIVGKEVPFAKNFEDEFGFSIKRSLPRIFESMSIEELEGTDLLEFCRGLVDRLAQ